MGYNLRDEQTRDMMGTYKYPLIIPVRFPASRFFVSKELGWRFISSDSRLVGHQSGDDNLPAATKLETLAPMAILNGGHGARQQGQWDNWDVIRTSREKNISMATEGMIIGVGV